MHLDVPPVRVPLPVLGLARVRSGVLVALGLLDDEGAVGVHPLATVDGQQLPVALPGDGLDGVAGHGALDDEAAAGHAGDLGHLADVR